MNTHILNEKFGHIHHLNRRIRGHRRAEKGGPTDSQKRILAALKLQNDVPTRDLAFILGIRVPSLNETLSKLEQAEMVTRQKSPEDGRIMLVSLTDAGREAADQERGGAEIYEGFSDEEREALGAYLDRIIENLEKISADFEDDTDQQRWESAARERMGDERFEEWLARAEQMGMRGGRGFERRGGRGPERDHHRGHEHGRDHGRERGGFPGGRGPWNDLEEEGFGGDRRSGSPHQERAFRRGFSRR